MHIMANIKCYSPSFAQFGWTRQMHQKLNSHSDIYLQAKKYQVDNEGNKK